MTTILETILTVKKAEVKKLKNNPNIKFLKRKVNYFSLENEIKNNKNLVVISEFKRASPSKGIINNKIEPLLQSELYIKNGARALSILTDQTFFNGSFEYLQSVSSLCVPILCKDFIIDEIQIDLAHAKGADVILLIATALPPKRLIQLCNYAKAKNLEVIVEIANKTELEAALSCPTKLIGINNRNLKTFSVDISNTERLAPLIISEGKYVISESGLSSISDIRRVVNVGVKAVLIGEAFMQKGGITLLKQFSSVPIQIEEMNR